MKKVNTEYLPVIHIIGDSGAELAVAIAMLELDRDIIIVTGPGPELIPMGSNPSGGLNLLARPDIDLIKLTALDLELERVNDTILLEEPVKSKYFKPSLNNWKK
jgi:hypothetical protein